MRITFLLRNAWGLGGTIKTTLNTAHALVERGHEVTIVSCTRHKVRPDFDTDPRIRVESLWDIRKPEQGGETLSRADRIRRRLPSFLHWQRAVNMDDVSMLLDRRVKRYVRAADADVLVGTQANLNSYLARYARRGMPVVAQEHLFLDHYRPRVRRRILRDCRRFDAVATITEADAAAYREAAPARAGIVAHIPNSIPAAPASAAERGPVVMAVGRLTRMKGFDLLVDAFASLAAARPEWSLHLYGRGSERKRLEARVEELGMQGRIALKGGVAPLDAARADASIAVVPSRFEPFGLVIVEAMAAGLPVLCTAVPHGPLEIVEDGKNGLLVAPEDPAALAAGLDRLMGDPGLRAALGESGRAKAREYEPDAVVGRHEALLRRAVESRRGRTVG
ncbi:glycosyltransferase [Glycomyces niveus]|uniref:Glycosyltransferase n=1 Tax=Glycomyces niveus TaxID=2820287 RepID=A0ABS3U650_9ACTN|nr:glycosyltransferase [Glycomyces sp. NEAU-S30]MBO3733931.1 glycosyltransferase [Glycomyces sp. NEAU-S30]